MTPFGSSPRIVLDTSAYSHLRVGHQDTLEAVASAAAVLMPAIVLGELEAGFRLGSREKENLLSLGEFLQEPFVTIVQVTQEVSQQYGSIFAQLKLQGTPIPTNDIWIAANTMVASATLIAFDRHFEQVENLSCFIFEELVH